MSKTKHPKRTKEEYYAIITYIRFVKKHGWLKLNEIMKTYDPDIEIK
jgi:hypothetical protein